MRTYTTPHFRIEQFKGPNKSDSWADDEYEDLRLYKNQTLTITALEGVKRIDAVVFNVITVKTSSMETALSATYSAGVTPNDDGDDRCGLTFDGDITTFSITPTEGQLRMNYIEIYFTLAGGVEQTITVNPAELDFGKVLEGEQKTKELSVAGNGLSDDIEYALTQPDAAFSISGSLSKAGGKLSVLLASNATVGKHEAELELTSGNAIATVKIVAEVVAKGGEVDADGSKEHPYSVSDVMSGSLSGSVWVVGYIWGQPASGTSLKSEPDADTAIALGDAAEPDGSAFMPAQLKDADIRTYLGLATNPEYIGRRVKIFGKIDTYFGVTAIKPVTDFEFIDTPDDPIAVTGVSLSETSLELKEGESFTLKATISPADAEDKSVVWTTSDDKVALVSNGTVKAVAEGTATITVTTNDGGFTASCEVTVTKVGDAVESVEGDRRAARKVLQGGHLLIIMPDGTTYTATGAKQ